jgi:MYXO-CTERM domain-containing protein
MIRTKLFLGCALAAAMLVASTASAQGPVDQRTYFTFSAPFELPGGKTLAAGKYTFRVLDSPSNRHVVQILNEGGTQIEATLLAIPAQRQDPPSEPEIRFMEAVASAPPAIRTWWYPGRTIGHEFIYPKAQARRLAQRQAEPVLTVATDATSTDEMQTADLTRVSGSGDEAAITEETRTAEAQPPAAAPAPMPRDEAPAPAPRVERPVAAERTELPRTASHLPLIGLMGLASLAAAAALRRRRA